MLVWTIDDAPIIFIEGSKPIPLIVKHAQFWQGLLRDCQNLLCLSLLHAEGPQVVDIFPDIVRVSASGWLISQLGYSFYGR